MLYDIIFQKHNLYNITLAIFNILVIILPERPAEFYTAFHRFVHFFDLQSHVGGISALFIFIF